MSDKKRQPIQIAPPRQWHTGQGRSPEQQEAYRERFDAIDWTSDAPNQARVKKALNKPNGWKVVDVKTTGPTDIKWPK